MFPVKGVEKFWNRFCVCILVFVFWAEQYKVLRHAICVLRMGEERGVCRVLVGKPEVRDHWGDLGVDGWIILGRISRRWDVVIWTGVGWPGLETGGGLL